MQIKFIYISTNVATHISDVRNPCKNANLLLFEKTSMNPTFCDDLPSSLQLRLLPSNPLLGEGIPVFLEDFCLLEVRAMVVAVQQPSAECIAIFTVCIV